MAIDQPGPPPQAEAKNGRGKGAHWLLLIPVVAVVFPNFYNFWEPTLWGIPFFYWYQILWVFLTAGLTWFLFQREEA